MAGDVRAPRRGTGTGLHPTCDETRRDETRERAREGGSCRGLWGACFAPERRKGTHTSSLDTMTGMAASCSCLGVYASTAAASVRRQSRRRRRAALIAAANDSAASARRSRPANARRLSPPETQTQIERRKSNHLATSSPTPTQPPPPPPPPAYVGAGVAATAALAAVAAAAKRRPGKGGRRRGEEESSADRTAVGLFGIREATEDELPVIRRYATVINDRKGGGGACSGTRARGRESTRRRRETLNIAARRI